MARQDHLSLILFHFLLPFSSLNSFSSPRSKPPWKLKLSSSNLKSSQAFEVPSLVIKLLNSQESSCSSPLRFLLLFLWVPFGFFLFQEHQCRNLMSWGTMFFHYMVDMCLNDYLYENIVLDETLVSLLAKLLHTCLIKVSICPKCLTVKFPWNKY